MRNPPYSPYIASHCFLMSLYTPSQPYLWKCFLNEFFICFSSLTVCFLGWLWGRRDLFINDCHVSSYLLHQRFTLDKLTPYLWLASLFLFLLRFLLPLAFSWLLALLYSWEVLLSWLMLLSLISLYYIWSYFSFFIGSYYFSIYRLKSMFMQLYIYFPINLLYNHIRKRVYSAINLQNKPLQKVKSAN